MSSALAASRDPAQYQRLTDQEMQLLEKLLGNWRLIPDKFKADMVDYLSVNPPAIPFSQVIGATQFAPYSAADVTTGETTTSTSFTDLATVGPTLTGLSDGSYLFFFGAAMIQSDHTLSQCMALKVNSTEAVIAESAINNSEQYVTGSRVVLKTLAGGGNNTVTCRYRVDGGTGTWSYRWMHALRVSN